MESICSRAIIFIVRHSSSAFDPRRAISKLKEDLIFDINYLKFIYNKCNKIFVIAALIVAVLTI